MDESLQLGNCYFRLETGESCFDEEVMKYRVTLHFPSDICRVCRCEGTPDRPLFHPCICTGSIKFIHQECQLT